MQRHGLFLIAVLAVSSLGAAPEGSDLSKIQGQWEASIGRRKEFSVALKIQGNEVEATISPKIGPKVRASGELQLDEAASLRSLDWVKFATLDGQEVPRLLSIYRLEGDKLLIRSGGFNDGRPSTFEKGGEGPWTDVLVFRRAARAESVTSNP